MKKLTKTGFTKGGPHSVTSKTFWDVWACGKQCYNDCYPEPSLSGSSYDSMWDHPIV